MASRAPHLPRRTFPDEIAARLRQAILGGKLQPGEALPPERELAAQLGTNRNTLREALRALEAEGLLWARQGDAVRVVDFRRSGEIGLLARFVQFAPAAELPLLVADLLRLRSIVSRELVRRAAALSSAADQALLRQHLADYEQGMATGAAEAVVVPELQLYRTMIAAGRSLPSLWLFNSLEKVILTLCEAYPGIWLVPASAVADWHRIIAAIEAHDEAAAVGAIDELLIATDALVLSALALIRPAAGTAAEGT
jgi:GntR family transcriptional regulator, transcriptional repressor for pyruvate dehydrogenase complex